MGELAMWIRKVHATFEVSLVLNERQCWILFATSVIYLCPTETHGGVMTGVSHDTIWYSPYYWRGKYTTARRSVQQTIYHYNTKNVHIYIFKNYYYENIYIYFLNIKTVVCDTIYEYYI